MSAKRLTLLAMYVVLSLAIYAVESLLPNPLPIPGCKLGLANIITLLLLKNYGLRDTCLVLLTRILIATLLFGQAVSLLYSLFGGLLALLCMAAVKKLFGSSFLIPAGITGGLAHNVGQLLAAFLIVRSPSVLTYLPFLLLCSGAAGLFTGAAAHFSDRYIGPYIIKYTRG